VSALGLQRVLGLGSYQTSWAMLHRFRRAMVRLDRERLNGNVEVDETYVGIRDSSEPLQRARRKSQTFKTLIAIAIEVQEPKGFGRIRLQRVPAAAEMYLLPFVCNAVEPGARVHTDGSPVYRSLPKYGYVHHQRVHLGFDNPAHLSMPGVHRVASLLKRWLLGTHREPCSPPNSTTTWMNSHSGLTAAHHARGDCCSIDCWSRLWPPSRLPISASQPARRDRWR
jgi:hypothetical protein